MASSPSPVSQDDFSIRVAAFTEPEVQRLVAEVQAHYVVIYGGTDDSPVDPAEFEQPQGTFALGTVAGQGVAMGGWRRRPDLAPLFEGADVAEIKRMYVAPSGRRRGLARQVLAFLEDTARGSGVDLVVLETGTMQPEAIALYEACGYERTVDFGHYAESELSRCYAKALNPA